MGWVAVITGVAVLFSPVGAQALARMLSSAINIKHLDNRFLISTSYIFHKFSAVPCEATFCLTCLLRRVAVAVP